MRVAGGEGLVFLGGLIHVTGSWMLWLAVGGGVCPNHGALVPAGWSGSVLMCLHSVSQLTRAEAEWGPVPWCGADMAPLPAHSVGQSNHETKQIQQAGTDAPSHGRTAKHCDHLYHLTYPINYASEK